MKYQEEILGCWRINEWEMHDKILPNIDEHKFMKSKIMKTVYGKSIIYQGKKQKDVF